VLSRLTLSNQSLLDLGCCFGQDSRYYAFRGAPPTSLYGSDLNPEFLELGYELFNDRATMDGHFIAGDIFAAHGKSDLDKFEEKMDMISATAFLHLFSWEEQVTVCTRMIQFLKPFNKDDEHGQLIFGRQTASLEPGIRLRENVEWGRKELFMHDLSTFEKLWKEVGLKTGTEWKVKGNVKALPWEKVNGVVSAETARLMDFEVWRVG
jgi:SAM-dependent methyltransferase